MRIRPVTETETPRAVIAVAFLLVVLLASFLRLTAASDTVIDVPIRSDAKGYVAYAYNWKNFGVYSRQVTWIPAEAPEQILPDALQQPGYPAFLKLFIDDGPPDAIFVRSVMIAQAILGVFIVIIAFISARLLLGSMAALFVMLLTAISPHLIVMENYLLSETLYALLVAAVLVSGALALKYYGSGIGRRWAAVTGVVLGLCCLVRPPLMQLAPVLLVLTLAIPALRSYRKCVFYAAACFLLVMSPWMIRNLLVTGHLGDPRLMVTTLIHGSYPDMLYNGDPATLGYAYRYDTRMAEISQGMGTALAEIGRKFSEHPITYLHWYLFGKIGFFFNWQITGGFADVFTYPAVRSPYFQDGLFVSTHALMHALHWPLVAAGLVGAMLVWTPRARSVADGWKLHALRWLSFVLAVVMFGNMIGAPYSRYSVPFRPLLYLLAVFALMVAATSVRARQRSIQNA